MQNRITAIVVAAVSYVGQVRERNEDVAVIDGQTVRDADRTATIALVGNEAHFFAVADGVGGAPSGDVASMRVATEMSGALLQINEAHSGAKKAVARFIRACAARVNDTLVRHARLGSRTAGMATTLTGAFVHRGAWWAVNCGDSRLYHCIDGQAIQLTRDHTLREFSGDPHIPGNIICNCFGSNTQFFVDVAPLPCAPGSVLLLCSDGLSDLVSDREIADALDSANSSPPIDAARQLISLADRAGARDNVTAVVLSCR